MAEPQAAGVAPRRGRRGQEADAEVQVVPHAQPAGAERSHPAAQVARHVAPRRLVAGEHGVGPLALVGGLEANRAAGEHGVPGRRAVYLQPQAGARPPHVEDLRVEAVGERAQGLRRRRHAHESRRERRLAAPGRPT